MTRRLLLIMMVLSTGLVPAYSFGVEGAYSGRIRIYDSLTLSESVALDFGQVNRPSSMDNEITLLEDDMVAVSGPGDAFAIPGTASAGQYRVYGAPGQEVVTSVSASGFTDPGLDLLHLWINGELDSFVGSLDAEGLMDLVVSGRVLVSSLASTGGHVMEVYLTANYQ